MVPPYRSFDMTYAHYATMGGFVVNISHLHNAVDKAALLTEGLLFLADNGHVRTLDPQTLRCQ